jgi:hypothetical protein
MLSKKTEFYDKLVISKPSMKRSATAANLDEDEKLRLLNKR